MKINKLKALRKARGLRQVEVAKKLNISQSLVSKYERGAIKVDMQLAWRIADLYNVAIDEIFEEVHDPLIISEEEPYILTEEDKNELISLITEFLNTKKIT